MLSSLASNFPSIIAKNFSSRILFGSNFRQFLALNNNGKIKSYYSSTSSTLPQSKSSNEASSEEVQKSSSISDQFGSLKTKIGDNNDSNRPDLDFGYLLDAKNLPEIKSNVQNRKHVGDIEKVHEIWDRLQKRLNNNEDPQVQNEDPKTLKSIWDEFYNAASRIPNKTSSQTPIGDESQATYLKYVGVKPKLRVKQPQLAEDILNNHGTLRTDLTKECGDKSYAFFGSASILERCLIDYAVDTLKKHHFTPIIVPDIVNIKTAEQCGVFSNSATGVKSDSTEQEECKEEMNEEDEKLAVYTLKHKPEYCLAGTGETGVASFLENMEFDVNELPIKFYTVSRCYRPEAGTVGREKHVYRVHEFTKVEMFGVTADETGQESNEMLNYFVEVQEQIFSGLNLHFRLLEMPSQELGAAAFRKLDIEAWMPGRNVYGEISSASNCTDFQSRRLNVKYRTLDGQQQKRLKFVHTVNATACAANRLMIALIEQNQTYTKNIKYPELLEQYGPLNSTNNRIKLKYYRAANRTDFKALCRD